MTRKPRTAIAVGLDDSEARRELDGLVREFRDKGDAIDRVFGSRVGGSIDGITSKVGGINELAGAFGPVGLGATAAAAGIAAAAAAAVELTTIAYELTDATAGVVRQQRQFADNLGISIETFSAYSRIAAKFGADAEDVKDVLKDLSVRAVENEKEFHEFGISIRDANHQLLTGEALFLRVADGISEMTNAQRQLVVADALAEEAGERLIQVLRLGSDEIIRQRDAFISNGQVITEHAALLEEQYSSALRESSANVDDLRRLLAVELLPVFTEVLGAFNRFVEVNRDDLKSAAEIAGDSLRGLTDLSITAAGAANALAEAWVDVGQTITIPGWLGFFDSTESALQVTGTKIAQFRDNLREAREDLERITVPFPNSPFVGVPDNTPRPGGGVLAFPGSRPAPTRSGRNPLDNIAISPMADAELDEAFGNLDRRLRERQREFEKMRREAVREVERSLREELRLQEQHEEERAAILSAYRGEDPVEALRHQKELELEVIQDALDRGVIAEREAAEQRAAIDAQFGRAKVQAELSRANDIVGIIGSAVGSIRTIEENLAGESEQRNEALFYVQQGVAAAQAGINTALAITRALAEMGPVAGPIAAAAMAAAGALQIGAILSASPGNPPNISSSGAGTAAGAAQASQSAAAFQPAPARNFGSSDGGGRRVLIQQINNFSTPVVDEARTARRLRELAGE